MQRLFRKDSPHIRDSTKLGWTVWIAIVSSIWILAFVIANVVPFFNQLNGVSAMSRSSCPAPRYIDFTLAFNQIISALFVSLFT